MSVIHGGFSPSPTNPPQTKTLKNGQFRSSYRWWGHWPEWSYQWRSQSQANWRICGNISSRQGNLKQSVHEVLINGSHKLYHNSMEFQQNQCIRHFMPDSRQLSSQKNKPQTNTRNWGCNPKKGHIIRKLLVKYLSNPPKKQHQTGQTAWIRVDHKKYEMIFAGNDLHTYETPGPTSSIWAYAQWLNA